MTILFDLGHPAHFHLFRNAIAELKGAGQKIEIIGRQKDCLPDLLARSGWPHHMVRRRGKGLAALAGELPKVLALVTYKAVRHRVKLMVGTSPVIGLASRLTGATSVVFCEDDAAVVPVFTKLAYPGAHYVVTPSWLRHENHGRKHLTYPGCHELAYLHPNRFRPDPQIRQVLGLGDNERYFLIRLVALRAHHDIGEKGLGPDEARAVVDRLRRHGRVFISAETDVPADLQPLLLPVPVDRIFDVVAFADMLVGDTQTMAIEAAVLGTPSLRCNTFVGRLSVMEELEHRYGLTVGIRPRRFDRFLAQIDDWLARPDLKAEWMRRRDVLLGESLDLTQWIVDLLKSLLGRRQAATARRAPR